MSSKIDTIEHYESEDTIKGQHADYDGICMPIALLSDEAEMQKHLANRYPEEFGDEISMDEEQVLFNEHLDKIINCDNMRTHRLPEDDEGMDETNQIPSRMPKALRDILNGVTPDNPQGVTQLVTVRLHNTLVDKLKFHGSTFNKGHQTLIVDIIKDYAKIHNL